MEGKKNSDVNNIPQCSSCSIMLLYLHLIIKKHILYFFDQTLMATIFFGARLCAAAIQGQLLFKVGIYFLEKPADITDS